MLGAGLAVLAHALPVSAQPSNLTPEALSDELAEVGSWKFAATKKGPDGKPECVETWHFDTDGAGWVQSGEQRVSITWRTAQGDKSDRWLYRTSVSSTAGKDCLGKETDPSKYPRPETGFVVIFFNSGLALTCQPAPYLRNEDGTRSEMRVLRDTDCWGSLEPTIWPVSEG